MKFGINFQLQTPRPLDADQWHEEDEIKNFELCIKLALSDQLALPHNADLIAQKADLITEAQTYIQEIEGKRNWLDKLLGRY